MPGPDHDGFSVDEIREMARQIRRDIIKMLMISKSGHSGGPLGLADIFASLYFRICAPTLSIIPGRPATTFSSRPDMLRQCGTQLLRARAFSHLKNLAR